LSIILLDDGAIRISSGEPILVPDLRLVRIVEFGKTTLGTPLEIQAGPVEAAKPWHTPCKLIAKACPPILITHRSTYSSGYAADLSDKLRKEKMLGSDAKHFPVLTVYKITFNTTYRGASTMTT
jgi:hypothetical protein